MLKVVDFIKAHPDWDVLLSQAPYSLNISYDEMFGRKLVLLKYNQQESDFTNKIVQECRGIILDITEDVIPFSVPYYKFFNYGEPNSADIDWPSAIVQEKIDGSLIKVVKYNNELLISTNGCIDAFKCSLVPTVNCPFTNFGDLFVHAISLKSQPYGVEEHEALEWFKSFLDEGVTYMFELVSPYNRIVIKYNDTNLYFHGMRDNKTLIEHPFVESNLITICDIPKFYSLCTLNECIEAADKLSWDNEGYVVVDKFFNRIKIKSPAYIAIHRMANNGNLSIKRAVNVFMENEVDELLTYFPEYKSIFDLIKSKYKEREDELNETYSRLKSFNFQTKKEQALWVLANTKYSGLIFAMLKDDSPAKVKLDELYAKHVDSFINVLGIKCDEEAAQ